MSVTISIIIPTYNRLYRLGELIEALSIQTFKDFEVIIVNDCGEHVDRIKNLYSSLKIKIINMAENRYHVHARNEGVLNATGDYIMLIDDDDLIVPNHLETMLGYIDGYDLVYSDVEIVKYKMRGKVRVPIERSLFAYNLNLKAMRRFSTFVPSGCLYRRSMHQDIGLFDPEVHNYWDWDFFLRVSDSYRVNRVPIAGVLYDFSDYNNNQSKNLLAMRQYLDKLSTKHHLGYLPTKNFFLLLNEPEVKKREAESKIVWNGSPFISKLISS